MATTIQVPPIKIQGIKTKLIPFIKRNARLDSDTLWLEPFMGSGVVGFNIAPRRAIFADINPYTINFYQEIKERRITSSIVREFLQEEGYLLSLKDAEHYYAVRDRFNEKHNPLDFLFLNRSCFNGMIRFNSKNQFNTPYGHKRDRFAKAYITKIVNQVAFVESRLRECDWMFLHQTFEKTLSGPFEENTFIYCDPPYIGRHVDYFDSWDETDEERLCRCLQEANVPFMLSTWDHNEFRENVYLKTIWDFCYKHCTEHFYHIGAKETNRRPMIEALLTNYPLTGDLNRSKPINQQLLLDI